MPFDGAWKRITDAKKIAITTHVKPDGDGLGSIAALLEALEAMGKEVRVVLPGPGGQKYAFLRGWDRFETAGNSATSEDLPLDGDLLIVVDTCTWEQLDGLRSLVEHYRDRILVVDHHQTRDDLRHQELVDVDAAAAGQIVMRLFEVRGVSITPTMAESLFVSLVSDTGWFRFPNVTPEVYQKAATLEQLGANPPRIYEQIFQSETLAKLKLIREALSTLTLNEEGDVSWFWLTPEMFARCGAKLSDTENIIDECQKVAGVVVGLLFVEMEGGQIRVSLRSKRDVDMASLAAGFGGGGHARAAGCRLPGPLPEARKRILNAVYEAMGRPSREWL